MPGFFSSAISDRLTFISKTVPAAWTATRDSRPRETGSITRASVNAHRLCASLLSRRVSPALALRLLDLGAYVDVSLLKNEGGRRLNFTVSSYAQFLSAGTPTRVCSASTAVLTAPSLTLAVVVDHLH